MKKMRREHRSSAKCYWFLQKRVYLFAFSSFVKLNISMKLEKKQTLTVKSDLEPSPHPHPLSPRSNQKLFFQEAHFLPAALTIKVKQ